MNQISTKYGDLHGIARIDFYEEGTVKECTLNEQNELHTQYGIFTPQYKDDGARRKHIKSLSFHNNGILKSISLHESVNVKTDIGTFPAELITFYSNGNIERIFPLNGKITGFWTEENEYELAQTYEFEYANGTLKAKVIGIRLFETGELRGLTLWEKERILIETSVGVIDTRIGLSFYSNGSIKSLEPAKPTPIETPIGIVNAYNPDVIGVNGDINSLNFNEDGSLKSFKCSTNIIKVTCENGETIAIQPGQKQNLFNNEVMDIVPLLIEFDSEKVIIISNERYEFDLNQCTFAVENYVRNIGKCSSCDGCTACG